MACPKNCHNYAANFFWRKKDKKWVSSKWAELNMAKHKATEWLGGKKQWIFKWCLLTSTRCWRIWNVFSHNNFWKEEKIEKVGKDNKESDEAIYRKLVRSDAPKRKLLLWRRSKKEEENNKVFCKGGLWVVVVSKEIA